MTTSETVKMESTSSNMDVLQLLEQLHKDQVDWDNNYYQSMNDRLLDLLSDCLKAYMQLSKDRAALRMFKIQMEDLELNSRVTTHLTTLVVRYVFRLTNNRTDAYAKVLRVALENKIEPKTLKTWVIGLGGIEEVRRINKDGSTPAAKAKELRTKVFRVLAAIKPISRIGKLPDALRAGTESLESFSVALVRQNTQTGEGEIVWGSDNAALTKMFIDTVAKDVIKNQNARNASATEAEMRAAQAAAVTAPVTPEDNAFIDVA